MLGALLLLLVLLNWSIFLKVRLVPETSPTEERFNRYEKSAQRDANTARWLQ